MSTFSFSQNFIRTGILVALVLTCSGPPERKHGPRTPVDPAETFAKLYPELPEILHPTAERLDPGKILIFPYKQDVLPSSSSIPTIRMAHDRIRGQYCIRFVIQVDQAGIDFRKELRAGRIQVPRYYVQDEYGTAHAGKEGSPMRFYRLIKTETGTRQIEIKKENRTVVDSPFYDAPDPKVEETVQKKEPEYRYDLEAYVNQFPQVLCFARKPNDRVLLSIHVRMEYVQPRLSEICYREEIPCPKFPEKEQITEMRKFCNKHLVSCSTAEPGPGQKCYRFQSVATKVPCPTDSPARKAFCDDPLTECEPEPGRCRTYEPTCPKVALYTLKDLAEQRRLALGRIRPEFEKQKGASFVWFEDPYGNEHLKRLKANSDEANARFQRGKGAEKRAQVAQYGSQIKLSQTTLISPPKLIRVIDAKP